jgi:hypothetical protein
MVEIIHLNISIIYKYKPANVNIGEMGLREVWIVYHKPSYNEYKKVLDNFLHEVSATQNNLRIVTIDEFTKKYSGGQVFALLLYRGGHYCTILDIVNKYDGCFTGIIPLDLTVNTISQLIKERRECREIKLLHHRPKRCFRLYNADISYMARKIEAITNKEIRFVSWEETAKNDCIIGFTLFSSKNLENLGNQHVIASELFPHMKEGLMLWISQALGR